jgi:hypothetical protein
VKKEKEGDTQAGAGGNQARNGRLTPKSETGWVRSEEDDKNWKKIATKTIVLSVAELLDQIAAAYLMESGHSQCH